MSEEKAPARLMWGIFYTFVDIPLTLDGHYPKSIVVSLTTVVDPEEGIIASPPRVFDEAVGLEEGWEFRLRTGCGCEMEYDAVEPPWVVQIRSVMSRMHPTEEMSEC